MAENYNGMAVGIFELDSFAACFVALDAASKAANVRIQNIERNRLGAGACVKMRGSVSDVTAAMEAATPYRRTNCQSSFPYSNCISGSRYRTGYVYDCKQVISNTNTYLK